MTCKECKGKGSITLFTSSEPCQACGGTGGFEEPTAPMVGAFVHSRITVKVCGCGRITCDGCCCPGIPFMCACES